MDIDINTVLTILSLLFTMVLGWIIGTAPYQKFKKSFDAFSQLMNEVNMALYDDKVTEDEFRKVWEKAKGFYEALKT
jgi:ABC-type glycerol-3-phosphate transport system permease component